MFEEYYLYLVSSSCIFAAFAYIYKFIRIYRKIEVNCWFCNTNTKVDFKFSNSFICPSCDQYNGFRENGDYNCIIPAQHSETYNFSVKGKSQILKTKDTSKFNNGFCDPCNLNQALKIRALAEFSSFSSDDNDEIEKFQERLEEIYGLCQQCQATLHQTLGKQNSWLKPQLISWKLLQSRQKSIKALLRCSRSSRKLHILPLLVCSILTLLSLEKYFPDLLEPLKTTFQHNFFTLDDTFLLLIYFGLTLQSVLIFSYSSKLLKVSNFASYVGWGVLYFVAKWPSLLLLDDTKHLQCILNILNLVFIAWISKFIFPDTGSPKTKERPAKNVRRNLNFLPNGCVNDIHSLHSTPSVPNKAECEESPKMNVQKDLDADLLNLKIGTPKKRSADFLPQDLFRHTSEVDKSSRNVVQPSKFGKHVITQSSWVAGGYWGSPGSPQRRRLTSENVSHLDGAHVNHVFSASRSSSQSSGFVSQFSDYHSSKSQPNKFPMSSRSSTSPHGTFMTEPHDCASVYSRNRSPINHASSFSTAGGLQDSFEAHSTCRASSLASDNSRTLFRFTPSGTGFCDLNHCSPSVSSDVTPVDLHDAYTSRITRGLQATTYFNLGIAFVLGLSVSANIFLVIILSHYIMSLK